MPILIKIKVAKKEDKWMVNANSYRKDYHVSLKNSSNYEGILQILVKIRPIIFDILEISGEFTQSEEIEEYLTAAGILPFSHKDFVTTYRSIDTTCKIRHCTIFNGHIGDTEHSVDLMIKKGEQHMYLDIDLYIHYSLMYRFNNFSEKQIMAIEKLIHSVFELRPV